MKRVAIFALAFLVISFNFGKSEFSGPDEPIGGLKVDAKIDANLKKVLKPLEKNKAWSTVEEEGEITAVYMVDMSKFKVKDYFGLKIERIEVRVEPGYNEKGETEGERVNSFTIYCKTPPAKEHKSFIDRIEKAMGPILTTSIDPEDEEIQSPNWFSEITLMTVGCLKAAKTIDGKSFVWISYNKGYG